MPTAAPPGSPDLEGGDNKHSTLETPLLGHAGASRADVSAEHLALQRAVGRAVQWSLVANIALLAAKAVALWATGSMAVAASAVDSLVDLASQALVALADAAMARPSPAYPAGKTRLEPLAVLGCAALMTAAAVEVVRQSTAQLVDGLRGGALPHVAFSPVMGAIMAAAVAVKLVLFVVCARLRERSGAALALAEDHANDIASNVVAIATAAAAAARPETWWWADPAGGLAISAYIVASWTRIASSQVEKIVGRAAPEETRDRLRAAAAAHHPATRLAFFRAFHAGQRLHVDVELESRSPGAMGVREASLIALSLKRQLEAAPEVESAAVVVVAHPAAALERRPSAAAWDAPMVLSSGEYGGHPAEDGHGADGAPGAGPEEEGAAAAVARGEGSLARQLLWGRSLRDSPAAALRATSFVGLGGEPVGGGGGSGGSGARPGSRG